MRQFVLLLLAALAFSAAPLRAQSSTDPGDLFVNAYLDVQQGEKAEQAGNLKLALSKLRSAAAVLDQISAHFSSWQPTIVDFRKTRTVESIARVQDKIARSGGGKTDGGDSPAAAEPPPLPAVDGEKPLVFEGSHPPLPPPATGGTTRNGTSKSKQRGNDNDLFAEASQRMKKLQEDLQKARDEAARLQKEKADLAQKLEEAAKAREAFEQKEKVLQQRSDNSEQALIKATAESKGDSEKVKSLQAEVTANKHALRDLRIEAEADTEYRMQLDDRFKRALAKIAQLTQERNAAADENASVPGKISDIQKQLDQVKKERDDLETKLQKTETQLSKVTSQRDDALTQVARLQEAQKQVDKLVADNATLMAKLADADKTIKQFKLEGEQKDQEIASLKKEVGSVKEQLAQAKKESADYQRQMADLQSKLEESGKQLAEAKAENTANATEKKKMLDENSILRGIVLRQQKEEAVRAKTRKVVLSELGDLEMHSKSLLKQIDYLSQPVVKLTDKERALFKKPELQISDSEIAIGAAADSAPAEKPATAATPVAETKPSAPAPVAPPPTPTAPASASAVPASSPTARQPAPPAQASTPAARQPAPAVAAAAPAPAPVVEVKTTPAPATPAKSKTGGTSKLANNAKKAAETPKAAEKSKPIEQPALPMADNPITLTLQQPAALPIATAPTEIGALSRTPASIDKTRPRAHPRRRPPRPAKPLTPRGLGLRATVASPRIHPASSASGGAPNVPPDMLALAREGKEQFERGNYLEAEKTYRKILAKYPNNLYTLSNLGVVLFRSNKLKLAEESFRKAIAVAPKDSFSHCTLGIVYYSQGRYDEAVNELTETLTIDPKNATAHNYLGITCSQKGWQDAAQKELVTATGIDPNYADANFNLAVVFATQTPPDKENARKYYQRAIELGAERDVALEQLIK